MSIMGSVRSNEVEGLFLSLSLLLQFKLKWRQMDKHGGVMKLQLRCSIVSVVVRLGEWTGE